MITRFVIPITTGMIGENAYIVHNEKSQIAAVIDPGDDGERIISALEERGLTPTHILLTHGHFDHTGAVEDLRQKYGAKAAVHEADAGLLTGAGREHIPYNSGRTPGPADILLKGGETIKAGGLDAYVMHTPGHTMGSVCYIIGDSMFSGDTLFMQSIGRTDYSESDPGEMEQSLARLMGLDKDYTVYPGHGPSTSLAEEKSYNPWLR